MLFNFTIIIPHYNIPGLLIRCVNSIPIREDIQVIVVDDGSIEGENYPRNYKELTRPYLEYYHYDQHINAGYARNVGLKHAKGKWLIFADADDFFTDEFLHILDEHLNAEEDILFFKSTSCYSNDLSKKTDRAELQNSFINDLLSSKGGSEENIRLYYVSPWGKFIKKKLVDEYQIKFAEVEYANDIYFSVMTGLKADKIMCFDELLYVITYRPGSLTSKRFKSAKELRTRIEVLFQAQKIITDSGYELEVQPATIYLPQAVATNPIVFWEYWNKLSSSGLTQKNAFINIVSKRRWLVKSVFVLMFILTSPLSLFSRFMKQDVGICSRINY